MATDLSGLSGKIALLLNMAATKPLNLSQPIDALDYAIRQAFTFGDTAAAEVDQIYQAVLTLADATPTTLDLMNLTNSFGGTITFSTVKVVVIHNTGDYDVEIGGAAANAWASFLGDVSDIIVLQPGAWLVLVAPTADGYAVAAGYKNLKLVGGDAVEDSEIEIVLIGINT